MWIVDCLLREQRSSFRYSRRYNTINVRVTRTRERRLIIRNDVVESFRASVVKDRTIRQRSKFKAFRRRQRHLPSVTHVGDANLFIQGLRRLLTPTILFFKYRRIICLRNLHTKALQVTRSVRLHRIRTLSGLVDLPRVLLHLSANARGRICPCGKVKRRFLCLLCLQNGRNNVMATSRRLRRLIATQLRQCVRVERRAPKAKRMFCSFVYRRVQLSKKCTMALGTFRLIRHLRRIRRDLANELTRISSVSTNRCGFLSAFNDHLTNLLRREDGTTIATASTNGKGNTVKAVVVTTILRFRRRTYPITAQAEQNGQACVLRDKDMNLTNLILLRVTRMIRRILLLLNSRRSIRAFCLYRHLQFRLNVTANRRSGYAQVLLRRFISNLTTLLIHRFHRQTNVRCAGVHFLALTHHACTHFPRGFASDENLQRIRFTPRHVMGHHLVLGCVNVCRRLVGAFVLRVCALLVCFSCFYALGWGLYGSAERLCRAVQT